MDFSLAVSLGLSEDFSAFLCLAWVDTKELTVQFIRAERLTGVVVHKTTRIPLCNVRSPSTSHITGFILVHKWHPDSCSRAYNAVFSNVQASRRCQVFSSAHVLEDLLACISAVFAGLSRAELMKSSCKIWKKSVRTGGDEVRRHLITQIMTLFWGACWNGKLTKCTVEHQRWLRYVLLGK